MRRAVLATCIMTSGLLLASIAVARPGADLFAGEPDDVTRVERTTSSPTSLLRLWSTVGHCVVQRDRGGALAFVRAPLGSDLSLAAARRLDPVFAGCLAGSRVPGPSSVVLRRAALANALGIARNRI
ncbi:MAG TPA: hypothetical protein VF485_07825 [Sphingomonas sp.]